MESPSLYYFVSLLTTVDSTAEGAGLNEGAVPAVRRLVRTLLYLIVLEGKSSGNSTCSRAVGGHLLCRKGNQQCECGSRKGTNQVSVTALMRMSMGHRCGGKYVCWYYNNIFLIFMQCSTSYIPLNERFSRFRSIPYTSSQTGEHRLLSVFWAQIQAFSEPWRYPPSWPAHLPAAWVNSPF